MRMGQSESLLQTQRPVLIPFNETIPPVLHTIGLGLRNHRLYRIHITAVSVSVCLEAPVQVVSVDPNAYIGPFPRETGPPWLPRILPTKTTCGSGNPGVGVVLSQRGRDGTLG